MVDPASLQRRLALLRDYSRRLTALGDLSPEAYAERRFEARYLVQVSAQVCIDMANHIIASEGWAAARDQRDSFARLAEQRVIDRDLAQRLMALAGLRNRLVHLYDEIDDDRVRAALPAGLSDFDAFSRAVAGLAR